MEPKPRVSITYCTQCRWLLRAAWLAQELLTTFEAELGEVALCPGAGGIFEIRVGEELIWSRQREGRFPEAREVNNGFATGLRRSEIWVIQTGSRIRPESSQAFH